MGKKSFAVAVAVAVAVALLGIVGCGGSDAHVVNAYVEDGSVARASIASAGCGANATLIELPAHCRWPDGASRRNVLATTADVVVEVDAEGRPASARITSGPGADEALDAAIIGCAMHGKYRPAWNGAGATCPTTIRLARYPTDLAPRISEASKTCRAGGVMFGAQGGTAFDIGPCQDWTPFR